MKQKILAIMLAMCCTMGAWSNEELTVYQRVSDGMIYYSVINESTNYGYMDLVFTVLNDDEKTCELSKVEYFWDEKYNYTLEIPGTVCEYKVKGIGKGAFAPIDSHYIKDRNLKIVLPNTMEYISSDAFCRFNRIKTIIIPEGLKSIGSSAFAYSGLESISIPNSIETVGTCVFEFCQYLTSVNLPESITTIPNSTFSYCASLKEIMLPINLEIIDENAFCGCDLESIIFPQSLKSIKPWAFTSNITSLVIPKNVCELYSNSFVGSPNTITVDQDNPFFDSRNNCNAIIITKSNTLIKGCINTVIPNTVTAIGSEAFANCYEMTELPEIPESVVEIGRAAFMGTQWDMNPPSGLVYAGKVAYCYNGDREALTSLSLRDDTKGIAEGAFEMCTNLVSATLPEGLLNIGEHAFSGCYLLSDIAFPSTIQHVGGNALIETAWDENLGAGLTYIGKVAYKYKVENQDELDIKIKDGTVCICAAAFNGIQVPMTIVLPSSIREIQGNAFGYCPNIQSVISHIKVPFAIDRSAFSYHKDGGFKMYFTSAKLYVPYGTKSKYEAMPAWNEFKEIVELEPEQSCSMPTITYADGRLILACETEGAECAWTLKSIGVTQGRGNIIEVPCQYEMTVYATKEGWQDSDPVTALLVWGDGDLEGDNVIHLGGAGGDSCDVNGDGHVDVADIATIIDQMAAQARTAKEGATE